MPTFKLEIQNKRKDGTYNVRIRLTHNREVRRLSTNLFASGEDLTRSLKLKNQHIIDLGEGLIKNCREACNDLGSHIFSMPMDELAEKMKQTLTGGEGFRLDFIFFASTKIPGLSPGNAMIYRTAINTLIRFIKRDTLDIFEINAGFLREFEYFISSEPSRRGANRKEGEPVKKKGERAVSLYMSRIKALYNEAQRDYNDEDRNIINIPYSPFNTYKFTTQSRTRKRAIATDLIQQIISLPYKIESDGSTWNRYNLAKDCFLLSFMLIGMNSADMYDLLPEDKEDTLTYNRKKTATRRDDLAEMRVRIEPCAGHLIDKYRDKAGKHLSTFCHHYADYKQFNRAINNGLKMVGKDIGADDLTLYAARHSWATIARSRAVGIDKATVHEALNHVDKDMRVTDIYIDKDWSVIWEANKKVLGLFDWTELELLYLL